MGERWTTVSESKQNVTTSPERAWCRNWESREMALHLDFTSPPSLWKAYPRFIFGRRGGIRRGQDFPLLSARWAGVSVDTELLQRYRECCEIVDEPGLPIHYPHVIASPMHLVMLTEPEFPLRLLGAVHARNHAIRYRPVQPQEQLDLQSRILQCRYRPQGYEIDFETQVKSAGELVWSEITTFLVRKKLRDEEPPSPLADVFPWEDEQAQLVDEFLVPKRAGKRYAAITGDYNPIHISRLLAKLFGFRRDLVHGMWGVARATNRVEELRSEGPVRVDIAFKGPLYMEHKVKGLSAPCEGGQSLRLFCGKEERPAVHVVVRAVDKDTHPIDVSG